ncbi:MAG TPA: AAA family ATPase [Smithellaceae bacterium]|nr:AAA family ATPase [Smithellaceae bacterium]
MAVGRALRQKDNVIHLTYEDMIMIRKEMIERNPLLNLGYENDYILPKGSLGAILAHAGVGKTALLVQMALHAMMHEKPVLHVSLNDAVSKVDLWYRELFNDMASKYDTADIMEYWEKILNYRFIMTFRVEGFSAPKLEERLSDLMEQNIFKPDAVIIDGLKFDESGRGLLLELKELAAKYAMRIWFTVHTHRHEPPKEDGLPLSFLHVADLLDVLVQLVSQGPEVYLKALKGQSPTAKQETLLLDPATMLIKEGNISDASAR